MRISSPGAAFCLLAISLLSCSCKEHVALFAEKINLEVELQKARQEIGTYDTKMGTVGQSLPHAIAAMDFQIKEADKTSAALTQEITELNAKSVRLDAALKQFRPMVEAYKAKHLQ